MDALAELEELYRRVLDETRVQAVSLEQGDVGGLTDALSRKRGLLAGAEPLMEKLRSSPAREGEASREGLRRVGALLEQIVHLEERCRSLAPAASSPPPARRVIAAYGKS